MLLSACLLSQCFFNNIVFAPFIFVEDPVDFNGQPGLTADVTRSFSITTPTTATPTPLSSSPFKIVNKVDPYYLITNVSICPYAPLKVIIRLTKHIYSRICLTHSESMSMHIYPLETPSHMRVPTAPGMNPNYIPHSSTPGS